MPEKIIGPLLVAIRKLQSYFYLGHRVARRAPYLMGQPDHLHVLRHAGSRRTVSVRFFVRAQRFHFVQSRDDAALKVPDKVNHGLVGSDDGG
ncbi:MAG: hypothetical protein ACLQNE_42875 [Thermoguttaceae bacterium]